jgi:isoleucyl-tRNA synthetase
MKAYDIVGAARGIGEFVNDLSTWYVRRSRDRMKTGTEDEKQAAVQTLGYTLFTLSKLMAPFTPFLAERLYKEMGGKMDSVHMDEWPVDSLPSADEELRSEMRNARDSVSLGLEQRSAAGIPVRQALASATLKSPRSCPDWMKEIIAAELNVHEVVSEEVQGQASMELDTEITPALRREGAARELVRHVNSWRKETGLTPRDRITATWSGSDFWREVMEERGDELAAGVLCDNLTAGEPGTDAGKVELDFHGEKIEVYPMKVS